MNVNIHNEVPFPVDVFGQADNASHPVAQFAREVMAVEGAPAEFVIPTLLAACSVAGARGMEVESFKGKFSRPNLYLIAEGQSGTGKSAIGQAVFGPIFDSERDSRHQFEESVRPTLKGRHRILEAKLKRAEKAEAINEQEISRLMQEKHAVERQMHSRRALVDDCTQEALEQVLSEQDGVVALISTDGRRVVKNLFGRHRSGSMEEDVYLKAWSGDPISVDRITRVGIPPVREPCLAMYLALQPDLFRPIFRGELVESGFVARVLPVQACEGIDVGLSGRCCDPAVLARYSQHIRAAFEYYRTCQRPHRFAMSPEARSVMDAFYQEAANYASTDHTLAPLYRRWAEQACRIAVCIQIAFFGTTAHTHPLDGYCAQKAVELMRWFGLQQRELLQDHSDNAQSNLTGRLLDLVQKHPNGISLRDAWKKLGSASAAVKAIIAADSRLELVAVPTAGRPTEVIRMKHATPGL
jgi:hypothetical protein